MQNASTYRGTRRLYLHVSFGCRHFYTTCQVGCVHFDNLRKKRSFFYRVRSRPRLDSSEPLPTRADSGIVANPVAAEVTTRKCFSRQKPPPFVGGYHSLGNCALFGTMHWFVLVLIVAFDAKGHGRGRARGGRRGRRGDSWMAPARFFACIGTVNRWPSRAGQKAPINRTHSKRFALADESADHALAFGVRASSAPLSQDWLQFDGQAGSWRAFIRVAHALGP